MSSASILKCDQGVHSGKIKPLPIEAIIQVSSSSLITSQDEVIVGLLRNSLDAGSDRVDIIVNSSRGSCIIEDNGTGIHPSEFTNEGGLAKMDHSSKHNVEGVHGRAGIFLASLSSLSFLEIVSQHRLHRYPSSVTFHHSKIIKRHVSLRADHSIKYTGHGTKVSVFNLFGNLPVRRKQRDIALRRQSRSEPGKAWDSLKRKVVDILAAWPKPIQCELLDADRQLRVHLNNSNGDLVNHQTQKVDELSFVALMHQAALNQAAQWKFWVPISASTNSLAIKGAICLKPSPTKCLQFISIGVTPLNNVPGYHSVFDEINRTFALSDFSISIEPSELERLTQKYNSKILRATNNTSYPSAISSKDPNKWPMFCLHIKSSSGRLDSSLDQSSNLSHEILELLLPAITHWLFRHNFCPRPDSKRAVNHPIGARIMKASRLNFVWDPEAKLSERDFALSRNPLGFDALSCQRPSEIYRSTTKRRRKSAPPGHLYNIPASLELWTGLRSGHLNSYADIRDVAVHVEHSGIASSLSDHPMSLTHNDVRRDVGCIERSEIISASRKTSSSQLGLAPAETRDVNRVEYLPKFGSHRGVGEALSCHSHIASIKNISGRTGSTLARYNKFLGPKYSPFLLSLPQGSTSGSPKDCPNNRKHIVNGVPTLPFLDHWNYPTFELKEKELQALKIGDPKGELSESIFTDFQDMDASSIPFNTTGFGIRTASRRISKRALRDSIILAQVDKKFVLAVVNISPNRYNAHLPETKLVVLIDQHAADERCRLEGLFEDMFAVNEVPQSESQQGAVTFRANSTPLEHKLAFRLPPEEIALLHEFAHHFNFWGIFFESMPALPNSHKANFAVTALPHAVASRCCSDKSLVLTVLRTELKECTKAYESPNKQAANLLHNSNSLLSRPDSSTRNISSPPESYWLRFIQSCPQGIIQLLNSRACRSAVMFNDVLSREECGVIVRRLARCKFPFQCAHGRPSMVPLFELDQKSNSDSSLNHTMAVSETAHEKRVGGFVAAFKKWTSSPEVDA